MSKNTKGKGSGVLILVLIILLAVLYIAAGISASSFLPQFVWAEICSWIVAVWNLAMSQIKIGG